jgi:hypothetical protein
LESEDSESTTTTGTSTSESDDGAPPAKKIRDLPFAAKKHTVFRAPKERRKLPRDTTRVADDDHSNILNGDAVDGTNNDSATQSMPSNADGLVTTSSTNNDSATQPVPSNIGSAPSDADSLVAATTSTANDSAIRPVPSNIVPVPSDADGLAEPVLTVPMSQWPEWLQIELSRFKAADLGSAWEVLLVRFTNFEARSGFRINKGPSNSLSTHLRPKEVQWWIQQGRDIRNGHERIPPIPNVEAFAVDWWSWWESLQPKNDGDWSMLDKAGLNGMLSIVACLFWWGRLVKDDELKERAWGAACGDVNRVLNALLSAPATTSE